MKQEYLERMNITMSHDELAAALGPAYQQIVDAGFVMVPKRWREEVIKTVLYKEPEGKTNG
jgi:hypothetical protein